MLVRRAYIPEGLRPESLTSWPYTDPCVGELSEQGLEFTAPNHVPDGRERLGKSTVVEALAEAFKLDAHGGRADRPRTPLGEVLRLETTAAGARMPSGSRTRRKGLFLRAETPARTSSRSASTAPGGRSGTS